MEPVLEKFSKKLKSLNLDGLLISHKENITYLNGFPVCDAYLLFTTKFKKKKKFGFFITDFRYWQQLKGNLKNFYLKKINGSLFDLIVKISKYLQFKKLGFESKYLPYAEYEIIRAGLDPEVEFTPVMDLVESLREIKSLEEIQNIKNALQINIQAFHYAEKNIRLGIQERELAIRLENFIRKNGAEPAFEIIVAFGENSSFPHHRSGQRRLSRNDVVLIDMGADFKGYKSDLTRVFFLGKIPSIVKKIHSIVVEAQKRAYSKIKEGVSLKEIDAQARGYIGEKGYRQYFGHALGHGVGLEIHEAPHLSSKNTGKLKEGMVFTLEPAIYLPHKFGIRIEDMFCLTKKGLEVLSAGLDKSI